jgi:hypothetical protein
MDDASRRAEVRKLRYQQYTEDLQRTGNNVLKFYMWLQEHRPDVVPKTKGGADPYQALKSELHGHWSDPQ